MAYPEEATLRASPHTRLAWVLAIGWAGFIWGLGSDSFAMASTSRFLGPLLSWLGPDWSPEQVLRAQVGIRKLAHAAEYGLFSLLIGRALALSFALRMRDIAAAILAAVVLLALADESRQAASTLRTGSAADVGFDVSGAVAALAALFVVRRLLGLPLFVGRGARAPGGH